MQRVGIARPMDGIRRVADNDIKRLVVPMLRLLERVAQCDIELLVVNIMQEHIDTAQVVGRAVNLLPVETLPHILLAYDLRHLQQQRTRPAGGVVHLLHLPLAVRGNLCQQAAYLLRRKELAARLARIAGIHRHQILIGVAKSVNLMLLRRPQVHIANGIQNSRKSLVALLHRVAEFARIDIQVLEQTPHIVLTRRPHRRLLDSRKDRRQRLVEVRVVLRAAAHISEELARQDKEALLTDNHRTRLLRRRIVERRIVEVRQTRLVLQAVDIRSDVLGDIPIEQHTQDILLEIPAVHRTPQGVGYRPNSFEKFLLLLCGRGHSVMCFLVLCKDRDFFRGRQVLERRFFYRDRPISGGALIGRGEFFF